MSTPDPLPADLLAIPARSDEPIPNRQEVIDDMFNKYFTGAKRDDAPVGDQTAKRGHIRFVGDPDDDRRIALQCLDRLGADDADDYDRWLNVGMALHSIGPDLLDAWDTWSRQSPKYQPGQCEAKWQSFNGEGNGQAVTLGTLRHMAGMVGNGSREVPKRRTSKPASAESNGEAHGDQPEANRPILLLPSPETEIRESAGMIGERMGETEHYSRFGQLARVRERVVEVIESAKACSLFEEVGDLRVRSVIKVPQEDGSVTLQTKLTPKRCSQENATKILAADAFFDAIPPINALSHCPVLLPDCRIAAGYDRESGIYAMGKAGDDVSVDRAVRDLLALFCDYRFTTEPDKSRAVAGMLTPALVLGDLLDGARCPAIGTEADQSQSGKGYMLRVFAAIYNTHPQTITQRAGGVGGIEEAVGGALIGGAPFVSFDNLRGKLDSPFIEAALTESQIEARVAYKRGVVADPSRTVFAWTSNKAELTLDLANRSSIIRIEKRPEGERFRDWPDGPDLLTHVQRHQPHYLACVHAVIREWLRQGRPSGPDPRRHDFHRWAGAVIWMTTKLFKLPDPLDGHRAVQRRTANQSENWLRDVAIVVKQAEQLGRQLQAHDLIDLLEDSDVPLPGMKEADDLSDEHVRHKVLLSVGRRMGKYFRKGDTATVDNFTITRRRVYSDTSFKEVSVYVFDA
ncbi:PriCT-2 domain-containing protein [Phycisphaerales bacterium AB-hyl4]|uniref:PriCT-2 domain-containing protein n=1 Tax=Natronomicrosphaera hydrolytica TaxID=3242702 RepID=A0ABV4U744_9BACT